MIPPPMLTSMHHPQPQHVSAVYGMGLQGSQLRALRTLVGTVVGMTAVMVLTKAYVDARVPRPPPKADKSPSKPKKKKKKGSLGESIQVGLDAR